MMNQLAPNIPVAAINQVMQQLITDNNQVVLLAGPEKEGVKYPTKEEIAALLKQMKSFDLKPYEDKVSNEPLLKEEPKGGKIVSEKPEIFTEQQTCSVQRCESIYQNNRLQS